MDLKELFAKMKWANPPKSTTEKVVIDKTGSEIEDPMEIVVYQKGKEIYRTDRFFLKGFNGVDDGSRDLHQGRVGVTMSQLEPLQVLEVRATIKEVIQRPNFIHALGLALGLKAIQDLLTDLEKEG